MTQSERIKIVARVLKKQVAGMTNEHAIVLAHRILETLDKPEKVEVKPNAE